MRYGIAVGVHTSGTATVTARPNRVRRPGQCSAANRWAEDGTSIESYMARAECVTWTPPRTCARQIKKALAELRRAASDFLSPYGADRPAQGATPRLQWRLTIITIPTILDLGGPDEKSYFDRLANEQGLHEKTRAEADSARSFLDRAPEPI